MYNNHNSNQAANHFLLENTLNTNKEIQYYNNEQTGENKEICDVLMNAVDSNLSDAESKVWHGSPVWFLNGNPIVGYCKLKDCVQVLFWSGQSFDEPLLKPAGKYKAAELRYTNTSQIDPEILKRLLTKSIKIQWDYKNIVKLKGELRLLQ
jgi:hypothetical protein